MAVFIDFEFSIKSGSININYIHVTWQRNLAAMLHLNLITYLSPDSDIVQYTDVCPSFKHHNANCSDKCFKLVSKKPFSCEPLYI